MYSIHGTGESRVLELQASSSHRFRFWHKEGKEQVRFKKMGGKLIAAVAGIVTVYKMPSANDFHREFIAHNNKALWLGLQSDAQRLVDNMLEYIEQI